MSLKLFYAHPIHGEWCTQNCREEGQVVDVPAEESPKSKRKSLKDDKPPKDGSPPKTSLLTRLRKDGVKGLRGKCKLHSEYILFILYSYTRDHSRTSLTLDVSSVPHRFVH